MPENKKGKKPPAEPKSSAVESPEESKAKEKPSEESAEGKAVSSSQKKPAIIKSAIYHGETRVVQIDFDTKMHILMRECNERRKVCEGGRDIRGGQGKPGEERGGERDAGGCGGEELRLLWWVGCSLVGCAALRSDAPSSVASVQQGDQASKRAADGAARIRTGETPPPPKPLKASVNLLNLLQDSASFFVMLLCVAGLGQEGRRVREEGREELALLASPTLLVSQVRAQFSAQVPGQPADTMDEVQIKLEKELPKKPHLSLVLTREKFMELVTQILMATADKVSKGEEVDEVSCLKKHRAEKKMANQASRET